MVIGIKKPSHKVLLFSPLSDNLSQDPLDIFLGPTYWECSQKKMSKSHQNGEINIY